MATTVKMPATRDDVMRVLREHEADIRAQGVVRLALFGSTVRNEARPDSDVDVLVEYDHTRPPAGFDIVDLQLRLSDLLDRTVQVADRKHLKPFLKDRILAEAVEVFPQPGRREPLPEGFIMPPRSPRQRLEDMIEAIRFIEEHAAGRTLDSYLRDAMLRAAIERKVEIISEASRHVPAALLDRHPHIPWVRVRAIGNILRHEYDDVYPTVIWTIVSEQMGGLRQAVEAMIAQVDQASS